MTDEGHLVAGRYRLLRRIGTGAMGVVWQGHDERLSRPVAVKRLLLQPGLAADDAAEAVARCLREGRIAARLHHPNAITVFDVVDEDGVPCLVMEYLPSRSLAVALAEDGRLQPAAVAHIGAQVAAALEAAHAAGIVHRDIKPANILLGDDGSVKITDFGISRAADDVAVTKSGIIAGTPAYLAPEVALGGDPTPASDVFSLGSTLYAAVEGSPPFGMAANTLEVLHKVALGKIEPPRRSGPLTDVLTALLASDPEARPTISQARELLAAVGRGEVPDPVPPLVVVPAAAEPTPVAASAVAGPVDEGTAIIAEPTELVARPAAAPAEPAPARRSRRPLVLTGVFVVALVAVGVWMLGSRNSLVPAEEQAPANGTGQSQTVPTTESVPVNAVNAGESGGTGGNTSTNARKLPAATRISTELPQPTTTTPTTPPPPQATTTDGGGALEPTTTTAETTTTPPPSSEEPSPPPTSDPPPNDPTASVGG